MDEIDPAILQAFVAEADENLRAVESSILTLERVDPQSLDGRDAIETMFRAAHTLKGNASSLGFVGVAELAHAMEDALDAVRSGARAVTRALASGVLRAVDELRLMFADDDRGELSPVRRELARRLSEDATDTEAEPLSTVVGGVSTRSAQLRIDLGKLDRLLELTSAVSSARGRMAEMMRQPERYGSEQIDLVRREVDRAFIDLQEMVLALRLIAIGPMFRGMARVVRDVASAQNKKVHLHIEGSDVEIDAAIVEQLRDALVHMVRNAVDHGVEAPEVRVAAGKPETATLRLTAAHAGGTVVIELSDDGAGVDLKRVEAIGRERRLLKKAAPSSDELLDLLFAPGFSTAREVTEISGRGVGMDVVRKRVNALRGTVALTTTRGKGTTATIRVPLTLATIRGLHVLVADQQYVIPIEDVLECIDVKNAAYARTGILDARGRAIPYVRLATLFGAPARSNGRETAIIVRNARGPVGLIVDALLGDDDTTIKPLPSLMARAPGISASAIVGTGAVALVLDPHALLREVERDGTMDMQLIREGVR